MNINISVISDIHFGAFDAEVLFNELNEGFLKPLKKKDRLDLVVITGDYYDKKISHNSKHARYSTLFFTKLISICNDKQAKIRVIQGTESHDNDQLELLEIIAKESECDIKFIYNVEEEEIFKDFKVLYIPEEYMTNKDEYYGGYFSKSYDMIFGHGMVQEVAFCALTQESATTMSKAPIFNTDVFREICRGPVMFGHIHTPQTIKDCVYYIGSFSRWTFGEEESKGYSDITYNTDNGYYEVKFKENKLARQFDTIEISPSNNFFNKNIEDQINFIHNITYVSQADFIRLKINLPSDYENERLLTEMVKDTFSRHKNIKILFNSNTKMKTKAQIEEKINALMDKYRFMFDKTINYDEKICRYIQERYGRNIPIEKIREYIFGDI